MKVKTKDDKKGKSNSWEAVLSSVHATEKGEASFKLTGWGKDEPEALENLDKLLESLLPRLQKYLNIK